MSKRQLNSQSNASQESKSKKFSDNPMISIDHTRHEDFDEHQRVLRYKTLNDSQTDIKFIVDEVEIPAHKEVIEILKDKRQLVRDAIERDKKAAEDTASDAATVFQMSGTTVNAFRKLLEYIYTGKVICDFETAVDLATTSTKLKFHPLVAALAQHLATHCPKCISVYNVDDLYHISRVADNRDIARHCKHFLEEHALQLNELFLKRDPQFKDKPNVLIYALDKIRYINYIHFLLPENVEICFNVAVSNDRTNWTVVLKNEEIWSKFWNWVYFEEKRIKFIRIVFTEQKGGKYFDIKELRDDHFLCKRANVDLEFDPINKYLIPKDPALNRFPIRDTKLFFDYEQKIYTYCMSKASNRDKEKFYYYHTINDKRNLEFYLSQTCLIDSFRIRLWDKDDRSYDFTVEVKNEDDEDWTYVKGDQKELFVKRKSWQTINLRNRRAVRWIRITGIRGPDYDQEFAIMDFECPAPPKLK